jgi:hypothetical protein
MAKIIIPEDGTRSSFVIYANYVEAINAFLETPLTDSETGDASVAQKSIPGHQRRRGPSDLNPINVLQSTASYLVDPSLKSGNAKPGISFRLKTDMSMADTDMNRQFTLVGRVVDFVQYFDTKMKYQTFFYPQNGGRHTLSSVPIGNDA